MTPPSLLLHAALVRLASATPEPAEVVNTPPPELIRPGTVGFLVTFFVAAALVLLVRDMVKRTRRIDVRAARRDAELQAEVDATQPDQAPTDGERDAGPRDRPAGPTG